MNTAHISFYKEVEKDNYETGVHGPRTIVFNEKFTVDFTDTNNLKDKLANYLYGFMDIDRLDFVKYVSNECENNRFDYSQNENAEGERITIDENNPDGYLADYYFYIDKVTEEIEYTF